MKKAMNHKSAKTLALVLCLILPCSLAFVIAPVNKPVANFLERNLYNLLWCGLYGCILVCLTFRKIWVKATAVALNLFSFGFLSLGALMGDIHAPLVLLLKAAIPFLPL